MVDIINYNFINSSIELMNKKIKRELILLNRTFLLFESIQISVFIQIIFLFLRNRLAQFYYAK
jgi:hypothetical protein